MWGFVTKLKIPSEIKPISPFVIEKRNTFIEHNNSTVVEIFCDGILVGIIESKMIKNKRWPYHKYSSRYEKKGIESSVKSKTMS